MLGVMESYYVVQTGARVSAVPCVWVSEKKKERKKTDSQNVGKRKYRIRYYQERHRKKSPRESTTSQPAAGSHGSLFLWTSLDFHTVNILSLRARGELWRRSKFVQIR